MNKVQTAVQVTRTVPFGTRTWLGVRAVTPIL